MSRKEIEKLLKGGQASINEWREYRKNHLPPYPDLHNIDLSNCDLRRFDLSEMNLVVANLSNSDLTFCDLSKTNLQRANLTETNFGNAILKEANLSSTTLNETNFQDADLENAKFDLVKLFEKTILIGAHLKDFKLLNLNLVNVNLTRVNFAKAHFVECDLTGASLNQATLLDSVFFNTKLVNTDFSKANLTKAQFQKVELANTIFDEAVLRGTQFPQFDARKTSIRDAVLTGAILKESNFSGLDLTGYELHGIDLTKAKFLKTMLVNANLSESRLESADLTEANLNSANLCGTVLLNATLAKANLSYVDVDLDTNLTGAKIKGCKIQRYTLECLDNTDGNLAGLPNSARLHLNIYDDVAKLRSAFSGFLQWLHLAALAVFIFPYAYFIFRHWTDAKFQLLPTKTVPLWEALLRFIWTGGAHWRPDCGEFSYSFLIFVYALTYNIFRLALLWKTKKLELEQESRGIHVNFTLRWGWATCFWITRIGFWANLIAVLVNSIVFLKQPIPI